VTAFWVLDLLCLLAILGAGVLVVLLPNLSGAVMALSALGTVMTVLFVALAAPDVAEAEAVVGTIALPVLYLVAIGKIRTDVPDHGQFGESEDASSG
jgi:energy-converting hydrogenase B subunit D